MKKLPQKILPSLLAGDFGRLEEEAKALEQEGADGIHIDIMDGHFVPNLTLGPKAVAAVNRSTSLFLDLHLMIYNPFEYIERFVEAGADRITFHYEATEQVDETLHYIRKCNVKAGLAFCPETSQEIIPKFIDKVDLILVMTVHPGFGGQKFMADMVEKVAFTKEVCGDRNVDIEVDGGINLETIEPCAKAGANVFVVGTHLFQLPDRKKGIKELRDKLK